MSVRHLLAALPLIMVSGKAFAQSVSIDRDEPTLDRWMYPFNFTPGARIAGSVFSALGQETVNGQNFDQRDAQFLIGFDVSPEVSSAPCPPEDLVVTSLVVTLTINNNLAFEYDPTPDAVTSYFPLGTPGRTQDNDAGRPIELFGVGYRNGFDQSTFFENSPFGLIDAETRNAFAADFDDNSQLRDVANNVRGALSGPDAGVPFDPNPFAIGTIDAVSPGALVPVNSVVSFAVDVSDPDIQAYLQDALVSGELRLMASSLQPAAFDGTGGGEGFFASFYTRNNIFSSGLRATLSLVAECQAQSSCPGDFNNDGSVDLGDFGAFGAAFGSMVGDANYNPDADFNADGAVDLGDFGAFGADFGRTDC